MSAAGSRDMILVGEYLKREYGEKIYKISLDCGFTCPNRDGSVGVGGCIFCSGDGSGDFAVSMRTDVGCLSLSEQIEEGKKQSRRKLSGAACESDRRYIAYFQAFTSTYGPAERLMALFGEAAKRDDIAIVSIATRPDCLGPDVLRVIEAVNRIKPVWVELGLQTIHEKSAEYINRCYPLETYAKAVDALKRIGLQQIITHLILGLPGESEEMMLASVRYVAGLFEDPSKAGIKLQLLHVLEGTALAEDYRRGLFDTMEMDEYVRLIGKCVRLLPEDMVLHRMTGDGNKKTLIAPLWSGDKKRVLNAVMKEIRQL